MEYTAECRQSGERLGESHLCKTMAGAVPSIIDIYALEFPYKKALSVGCETTDCEMLTVAVSNLPMVNSQVNNSNKSIR